MLNAAVIEVVPDILQKDPNYEFPNIVKKYYDKDFQVQEFPWDVNMREEDQHSYHENDQEGSIIDEHSKNSFPDTPSMNIRDPRPIEEIPRINLEASSKNSKRVMTPLKRNRFPDEYSSQDIAPREKVFLVPEDTDKGNQDKIFLIWLLP